MGVWVDVEKTQFLMVATSDGVFGFFPVAWEEIVDSSGGKFICGHFLAEKQRLNVFKCQVEAEGNSTEDFGKNSKQIPEKKSSRQMTLFAHSTSCCSEQFSYVVLSKLVFETNSSIQLPIPIIIFFGFKLLFI